MKNKFKVKSLNSGTLSKALTAGVLACALSCGAVMPKMAEAKTLIYGPSFTSGSGGIHFNGPTSVITNIPGVTIDGIPTVIQLKNKYYVDDNYSGEKTYTDFIVAVTDKEGKTKYYTDIVYFKSSGTSESGGYTTYHTYELTESEVNAALGSGANVSALFGGGGASYTADNGIAISSDNKVSVKPGTNVTVNANGVSVTGNGSVADGNTGLINGDKLYDEVRPSANGNYVIQLELYNFISSFPLFCSFLTIP